MNNHQPAMTALSQRICRTLTTLPEGSRAKFYRSSAGAEIDLVIILPGGPKWAIEIKRSLSPKVERGFITFVNISNRNAA